MAEYEACILGLRMAIDMNIKELLVIGDSDLLVHQGQGEWTTKNVKILPYLHYIKELSRRFTRIEFKHVPRAQNKFVDALAILSSMIQHPDKNYIDPIDVEIHDQHAYYFHVDEELDGKPWYYDIRRLIEAQEYPENATRKQKRTLRRMPNHFFLNGEILYRRTPDLGLLRCVDATEATRLLEEIHVGTCGPHMNGFTLEKKILRAGYFWMTMERDSIWYVQKCHQCQVHGFPLAIFCLGHGRYRTHRASRIKWTSFHSGGFRLFHKMGRSFDIQSIYEPQMNGAIEAANKNIKKILRRIVDSHRQWHEKLPYALLGYRTTIRTSTGETHYMLVYGSEAIIPAEVEIPSLRIIQEVGLDNAEWIGSRHEQLMLIDEKRMNAVCHRQLYQNRMTKAFNKKVKPRQFTPRQLVLKKIFPHQGEAKGNCTKLARTLHGS
ncbi:uncharacterized protein [Solanum tuberosum]|uniref:uncharacterized protein n=1 Tax=Solanum tuberosum TaxID=4113 RepID=UPI00073A3C2F|nr:PREDICTED: uncharacterized protein LOC107059665 [Solanum tuberosum]